jgi:plasmid stability protein
MPPGPAVKAGPSVLSALPHTPPCCGAASGPTVKAGPSVPQPLHERLPVVPEWIQNGTMPVTLSIKNVPDELAEQLRQRAERNQRSLQGELMVILEAAARGPISIEELARRVKAMGLKTPGDSVEIIRAMRDGRGRR